MAETDWKSTHLSWIKSNEKFVPKYASDYSVPYYNIMLEVYKNKHCSQQWAENAYYKDVEWSEKCKILKKKVYDQVMKDLGNTNSASFTYFLTIGFNHQTWSISLCEAVIKNILKLAFVNEGKAVFELHTENGEHPHCHFKIQSNESKKRFISKIWASRGIKRVVSGKNFIECEPFQDYHEDYIDGYKKEEKHANVLKDIEWRENNNLQHIYEKTT